jgi:hypothetical protein
LGARSGDRDVEHIAEVDGIGSPELVEPAKFCQADSIFEGHAGKRVLRRYLTSRWEEAVGESSRQREDDYIGDRR